MRRTIIEEPFAPSARWALRLGWFAVVVTLLSGLLLRADRVEVGPGLAAVGAGVLVAMLAIGLALAAFARIWRDGWRGLGAAVGGLLLAVLVLLYPGYLAARGLILPRLTDVTTDLENPPSFSRSRLAMEARGGRVPPDPDPATRAAQRAAYPQVAPLTLDLAPEEAFEVARKAAVNRGWQIVETLRPGGRVGIGRIEAVARSRVLRLPDDVTVRVRPRADGARIDVRSASRVGDRDFGQNADRVRAYLEEVSNLAITTK